MLSRKNKAKCLHFPHNYSPFEIHNLRRVRSPILDVCIITHLTKNMPWRQANYTYLKMCLFTQHAFFPRHTLKMCKIARFSPKYIHTLRCVKKARLKVFEFGDKKGL